MKSSEWTVGVQMFFLWIPQVRFIPNTVTYCLQTLMRRRFSNRGQAAEHWDGLVLEGADWSSHKHSSEHPSAAPVEVSDAGGPSVEAAAPDRIGDKQQQSSRHNRLNKNTHSFVTPGMLDQPIKNLAQQSDGGKLHQQKSSKLGAACRAETPSHLIYSYQFG